MPRFLHTADWQIGRQYSQFSPEEAVTLAAARIEAIETIARLANENSVDAILVAGDVFDAQTVAERTIRKMFNAMAAFTGPWIMITGNHDAALPESVWTQAQRLGVLPVNLHLALEGCVFEFASLGFAALCAPLTQRHTYNDLTENFDILQSSPGLVRVGLAHGSVQGILAEDIDSSNPISPDRARLARLDYLAMGDWHGCKQIDSRTWYSGTPEQDRFKGNEPGFSLLVQIDSPGEEPSVSRLVTGQFNWQQWQLHIEVASDVDGVLDRLTSLVKSDVLQLTLTGEVDLAGQSSLVQAIGQAQAKAHSLVCDMTGLRLIPTEQDISDLKADGYLGDVIADLRDRQSESGPREQEVASHALALLTSMLAERQPSGASV